MQILEVDSCSSTNILAANLAREKPFEPHLIISHEQTEGKGQRNKIWHSPKNGSWYFSISVPNLNIKASESFKINWLVIAGLLSYFKQLKMANIAIKWPNDIYTENGKLGGVLIENQVIGERIKSTIVGVGINKLPINIPESVFGVTSLVQESIKNLEGNNLEIQKLSKYILASLTNPSVNYEQIFLELNQFLFGKGKTFLFKKDDEEIEAMVIGLTKNGMLQLVKKNNSKQFTEHANSLIWLHEV